MKYSLELERVLSDKKAKELTDWYVGVECCRDQMIDL